MGQPNLDAPDSIGTLLLYLGEVEGHARDRGRAHQFGGRVRDFRRVDECTLAGQVLANQRDFDVRLTRTSTGWIGECTCGLPDGCEHSAALAFEWIERRRQQRGAPPRPPAIHSQRVRLEDERLAGEFAPAAPPKVTFRQEYQKILKEKLGRPLTAEEGAFLGRLSELYHNFRQNGRVSAHELARLGFNTHEARLGHWEHAFAGWWEKPPASPLELWQYLAYDLESSGQPVPEFLQPVTDTTSIARWLRGRQRREAIQRWTQRFDRIATQPPARLPTPLPEPAAATPLDLRLRLTAEKWIFETRPSPEQPWKEAPSRLVDAFILDGPAAFADLVASPEVVALLALCADHYKRHYYLSFDPGHPEARSFLSTLLAHPRARGAIVDAGGGPITFSSSPITWRLVPSPDGSGDFELSLQLPDGTPLPPAALRLGGTPELYLHRSVVYAGPPALDGSSPAGAVLPIEVVTKPAVLRTLRQFGTQLPPEIIARLIPVRLRARLECSLHPADDGGEHFVAHLHAFSDQPPAQQTWTSGGWRDVGRRGLTESAPGGETYDYSFSLPAEIAARLPALKLRFDSFQDAWTRKVTRAFAEEFLAWREALPAEVEVIASGELASLLGAPVHARVDFSLVENHAHRDWFDLALALRPEDSTLTAEEIALLLKARGRPVRLPGKGWRRLAVQLDEAAASALASAGFDPDSLAEAAFAGEKHRLHALQLAQSAIAAHLPERHAAALRARARELTRPEPPPLPADLRAELRPYQREGFHFLSFLSANRLGGILADDMGLGKTVQALAWLLWLAGEAPRDQAFRALVVCPKTVMGNWVAETARFAPTLATVRYTPGLALETADAPPPTLVVANYAQLRLNAEFFTAQRWQAVILDEGQFIKTPSARVAQVARDLPGEHRLVLTGTPIENRLLDLWSLFAFALPGLLGTQTAFKRHYADDNPLALPRLRARVRHFLLRRTKAQVASDLPARTEEDVVVDLEGEQRRLYDAELKRARAMLLQVSTPREFDQARFNLLASLLRLRQICCHPVLIAAAHEGAPSAKLDELMERLEELRDEGHQVLVFSQFVSMLEIIRNRLATAGIEHLMITGQTEDRDQLVQQFQAEKRHTVFLLSLKAAGFGLNLTAASYVILYDPWWNPAVEAQAIDRTHRIGQSLPVTAYRLIARGTVEEKIRTLQREKAALAGAVVQEESLASVLDLESLQTILA
ncbi:MAG: DEAD/DEAH box helicase [Verrucomicrobia bacterium]|nr:DEAD/DEAH box helicase [Verrucomicrobiota bacterium]